MSVVSAAVEPTYRTAPAWQDTLGPDVADLADLAGFGPDPEQRLGLDAIFAANPQGLSAAFEVAVIACRQNLKTGLFKQAALGWLFMTDERLVVWSAHEWDTVKEAFRDLEELITGSDWLRRRVKHIYRGNGDEAIELTTGARLIFKTRTKGGGRGLSGRKVILDEGFALKAEHMGALLPTLSAQPDPQVLYGSSAGLAESAVLRGIRDRGRAGKDRRLAYFEWCAPPPSETCAMGEKCPHTLDTEDCGCDDPANWQRANPAMGRRISVDYISAERRAMPPEEFGRERMGWWDDPLDAVQPISLDNWSALAVRLAHRPDGEPCFFLDCSPGLSSASVTVAATNVGKPHLELADYGSGADWLVGRAVELKEKHPGARFAVFAGDAVSALLPALRDAGIEPETFTNADKGRACAHLQRSVVDKAFTHSGDALWTSALKGAVKRDIGDDLWTWSRRKSTDITALVSATGAAWLLETQPDYDVLESVH